MKKILVILFLLSITSLIKSQNVMSDKAVFENFVAAINSGDVNTIYNYMSEDHVHIDGQGNKVQGREKVQAGWEGYFRMFRDYKIEINSFTENATVFLAEGTAEGTYGDTKSVSGDNYFKIPAAWKAVIENGKVKQWQIFADTKVTGEIIDKYSSGRTDSRPFDGNTKVTGIGGVFLKSKDPKALGEWYNKHLGTNINEYSYMSFEWSERGNAKSKASTTFGLFGEKSKYFDPSTKDFMMNFRVKNLDKLLDELKTEGVILVGTPESFDYGKFAWIMDPDGNKIELWEPIDQVLDQYEQENKK